MKKPQQPRSASILDCFRYASFGDYLLVFFGLLGAIIHGIGVSSYMLITGYALNYFTSTNPDRQVPIFIPILYIVVGLCIFAGVSACRYLLRLNAQHQGYKLRNAYLSALLQQDISFYSSINPMEISSQMENAIQNVTNSLDLHLATMFTMFGAFSCGIIGAFLQSWELSLIVFAMLPLLLLPTFIYNRISVKAFMAKSAANTKAGAIAEEALTNVRTVASLGGERAELERYNKVTEESLKVTTRAAIMQGVSFGFSTNVYYIIAAVITYIGSQYILTDKINPSTGNIYRTGDIYISFAAITSGFYLLPVMAASFKALSAAKVQVQKILNFVDSVEDVKMDASPKATIQNFSGSLTFKNVSFFYPSRPENQVLNSLSFHVEPHKKVAIVGESGAGKTSIFQLIQRFYDNQEGVIELDGVDIKTLDKTWLRENVSYVGQEPVLFSMTIRENLRLGRQDATEEEIIQALKQANAYDFVMNTDMKLDTLVGGGAGTQLSGGQKQRLSIARAILKNAKIVLLDEATSALDRWSEEEVQKTLNNLPGQPTVIIIAHRLSTIKGADEIIVVNKGEVAEIGRHDDLMAKKAKYFELQSAHKDQKPNDYPKPTNNKKSNLEDDKNEEGDAEEGESQDLDETTKLLSGQQKSSTGASGQSSKREEEKSLSWSNIKQLWNLLKQGKNHFVFGVFIALFYGLCIPIANVFSVLAFSALAQDSPAESEGQINLMCIFMLIFAGVLLLLFTGQTVFLAKASDTFVQALKGMMFFKFLRMHIGWHDDSKNGPGKLVSRLEIDASNVSQIVGTSSGIVLALLSRNLLAFVISFLLNWQISLLALPLPIIIIIVAIQGSSSESRGEAEGAVLLSKSDIIISEILNNMRTVISLNSEQHFRQKYNSIIGQYYKTRLRTRTNKALMEGFVYLLLFSDFAAILYLSSNLYFQKGYPEFAVLYPFLMLSFFCFSTTQLYVLSADIGRGTNSVKDVINILNLQSNIDVENDPSEYRGKITGNIEFKNVKFTYPTRKGTIFRDLNFKISAGQQIGVTGPSGSGKSTIIHLLLRFYDVDSGQILIDDVDIKDYNLKYLRRKIAVVSQQPVLFSESIDYNLRYANDEVSNEELRKAVESANVVSFMEGGENDSPCFSPPTSTTENNYQRIKGGQLSGGQKQRVAIARAILRKPKIFLLDEATSALDTQSERAVQEALTEITKGLTTICIAHRLDTIRNSDCIMILKDHEVAEQGSFKELMEKKGHFYHLIEEGH